MILLVYTECRNDALDFFCFSDFWFDYCMKEIFLTLISSHCDSHSDWSPSQYQSAIWLPYITCISPLYSSYHTTDITLMCGGMGSTGLNGSIIVSTNTPSTPLRQHQVSDTVTTTNNYPLYTIPVSLSISYQLPPSYSSTVTTNPHSFNPLFSFVCWNENPRYLSFNVT